MPRPLLTALAALAALLLAQSPARADDPCNRAPDPAAATGSAEEIFIRAREAFDAKRFLEAAPLFRAVALDHPDRSVGIHAVALALESLNVAARDVGPTCFDLMAADVPRYLGLYCGAAMIPASADECAILAKIQADIERLGAEKIVKQADAAWPPERAWPLYVEAGKRFLAIWDEHQKAACQAKAPSCKRAEEILYNAARAYQAGRDLPAAIAVRMILLDPANNLASTELAKKVPMEIGGTYQALAEYALAADWYERFATESPKAERAISALGDSVVLRLGLGDFPAAQRDAERVEKLYGASQPERVARIELALAEALGERSRWAEVERRLDKDRALLEKQPVLLRLRADALLGRALAAQGKKAAADAAYARIDAVRPEQLVHERYDDDGAQQRELARGLTAIGEARLYLADHERDAAQKIRIKKGDLASFQEKRTAVDAADRAYARVLDIQPLPLPRAVVAAAGRVARMRAQLWAQTFLALGAQAADVEEQRALAANERCVQLETRMQTVDAGARACAAWLTRHAPARFPAIGELVPAPRFVGDAPSRPPPVGDTRPPLQSP